MSSSEAFHGMLPKSETQSLQFVNQYPQFDGRGIIVGILDTGVDPAAAGLSVCPDGRPKVIDVVDCSGSGDIHMSAHVKHDVDTDSQQRTLLIPAPSPALQSKRLQLNSAWSNPTGNWRYGSKRLWDFYPKSAIAALKDERQKAFSTEQKALETQLQFAVVAAENKVGTANSSGSSAAALSETPPVSDSKTSAGAGAGAVGGGADGVALSMSTEATSDSTPAKGAAQADAVDPSGGIDVEELRARLTLLRSLSTQEDVGPVLYCVVWHDGERLQAGIDSTNGGDFRNIEPMAEYRHALQYRRFTEIDAVTYAVNFFNEGEILSIVCDAGAHGTHVASIVAAYYPNDPASNGVAPGAQIVSLKIGDTRLGSMETAVGVCRAMIEAKKRGCHIINMSYGEATSWENSGAFVGLANELVTKHGILFCASAGNNGPALSTVGCPGGTTSHIMSVGALAVSSLMGCGYHLSDKDAATLQETNYTWSSCGPALDGGLGVSFVAPGGAITSVPNWTHAKSQLMNGTSMSSPNATGCIALLLSAIHNSNLSPDFKHPAYVRRIVENTAAPLAGVDRLGQGHGLIQVQSAWNRIAADAAVAKSVAAEVSTIAVIGGIGGTAAAAAALSQEKENIRRLLRTVSFNVNLQGKNRKSRGIYLRQEHETTQANSFNVDVSPEWHENACTNDKIAFELKLVFKLSEAAAGSWIQHTDVMIMVNSTKTMKVFIDPRRLPEGHYSALIGAYLQDDPDSGPVFEVPVTVVKPISVASTGSSGTAAKSTPIDDLGDSAGPCLDLGTISLSEAQRYRRFVTPPAGCQYIEVVLSDARKGNIGSSAGDGDSTEENGGDAAGVDAGIRTVVFHALQTMRGVPYRDRQHQMYIYLKPGSVSSLFFPVLQDLTCEITFARFWNTVGETCITGKMFFRGVSVSPSALTLSGGARVGAPVDVSSPLGSVDISPECVLDMHCSVHKPLSTGVISPLGERDLLPNDTNTRFHQLCLSYEFEHTEAGAQQVMPTFPGLQGILYESSLACQLFTVRDCNGKVVSVGDAWQGRFNVAIKGKYSVQLQIRHTVVKDLENLTELVMILERLLTKPLNATFYLKQTDAFTGAEAKKLTGGYLLNKGAFLRLFPREPTLESLPKNAQAGDIIRGQVTFMTTANSLGLGQKDKTGNATARKLHGLPVSYVVTGCKAAPKKEKEKAGADGSPDSKTAPAAPAAPAAAAGADGLSSDGTLSANGTAAAAAASPTVAAAADAEDAEFTTVVRDAQLKLLSSRVGKAVTFGPLQQKLLGLYPDNLVLRQTGLAHACSLLLPLIQAHSRAAVISASTATAAAATGATATVPDAGTGTEPDAVITACDAALQAAADVCALLNPRDIAAELGMLPPSKDDLKATAARKKAESDKVALVEALSAKAHTLLCKWLHCQFLAVRAKTGSSDSSASAAYSQFDASLKELQRWEDTAGEKYWFLNIQDLYRKAHWGKALKKIRDLLDKIGKGEKVAAADENWQSLPLSECAFMADLHSLPSAAAGGGDVKSPQGMTKPAAATAAAAAVALTVTGSLHSHQQFCLKKLGWGHVLSRMELMATVCAAVVPQDK